MNTNMDADRVRWPGSGSLVVSRTPFGTYDMDPLFVKDCQSAAGWAANRLGYPVVDIEMLDINFYACFEESVNEYNAQVAQFNIRNNISVLLGQKITDVQNASYRAAVGFPMPYAVNLAKPYGTEVGVGGSVNWKKGYIDVVAGQQTYDLQALWGDVTESFNRIEVRRVFHERPPAFARIYDPFSMTGMSYSNILNEMGFGAYSPAVQFLMTPIFEDLLRGQAIEFNDMVRKSQYSFQLINNKLSLFPVPTYGFKTFFEYTLQNESFSGSLTPYATGSNAVVTDYSNVPYNNHNYSDINDPGKQWIRKYFLALCKELLGCIRQKYQTIPIPGGEVTLDGAELRQEAQQEKELLMTQLRENLDQAGKKSQMETMALEAEQLNNTLKMVPLFIYVGVFLMCCLSGQLIL
jgi:hypothetical protein